MAALTSRLYLLLAFLAVFLPAGSIHGINLKTLVFGCFVAAFIGYLFSSRETQDVSLRSVMPVLLTSVLLLGWALIGAVSGRAVSSDVLAHLRDIGSTISIAWFGLSLIRRNLLTAERLIGTVVLAVFALSFLKLAVVSFGGVNILETAFPDSLMLRNVVFGVIGIQFPADILCPLALFALLAPGVSGIRFNWISSVASIVIAVSVFLSYSRYIWLLCAVALLAALIVRRSWKLLPIAIVATAALTFSFSEAVGAVYEARFLSNEVSVSDDIRVEQSRALLEQFKSAPMLGSGLGAHVNGLIRSDSHAYSYELQWLALLMQFGIIGMAGLLLLIWASARDLLKAKHPSRLCVSILFALWLLSSFTNPYLSSSFAGVVFAFFMAMFCRMRMLSPGNNDWHLPHPAKTAALHS